MSELTAETREYGTSGSGLWWQTWSGMLALNGATTNSSGGVTGLYLQSARLYLYSHIYRGRTTQEPGLDHPQVADLDQRFRESALSVLRIALDGEMRLFDLPSYFGTMLAYAAVSLVRIVRDNAAVHDETQVIVQLLLRLSEFLRAARCPPSSSHPYIGIFKGLGHANESLQTDTSDEVHPSADTDLEGLHDSIFTNEIWNMDFTDNGDNWMTFDEH